MLEAFALVGELDPERSDEMAATLQHAGYQVRHCTSALQLDSELHDEAVLSSTHLLIVAVLEFATLCSAAISRLAKTRAEAGRTRPLVVLLCQPQPLLESLPHLEFCDANVILLETFDPGDLLQLADPNPFFLRIAAAVDGLRS